MPFRSMRLNESIVKDASLTWFGELGYAVGHGPQRTPGEYARGTLIPAFSQGEKEWQPSPGLSHGERGGGACLCVPRRQAGN